KLGPKEMKGKIWDQKNKSKIVQINISHGNNCINSFQISIASADDEGMDDVYAQKLYGKPDGMNFSTVAIDHPKEFLVCVSGEYLNGKLASIVFVTNKRSYGPFGKTGGGSNLAYEPFSFDLGPRNLFGGFDGSVYKGSVHAIGVYVKPYG
nr:jacalin-like lectin domain-containing protein [Tanacetum cinerariifolium]